MPPPPYTVGLPPSSPCHAVHGCSSEISLFSFLGEMNRLVLQGVKQLHAGEELFTKVASRFMSVTIDIKELTLFTQVDQINL